MSSADGCLGLRPCFAGLDALVPRLIKFGVTSTSTVSEPRTTATTATAFSRFLDGAAFWACKTGRDCVYSTCRHICQNKKCENNHCLICARIYLHGVSLWTYICRPLCPQTTCDQRFCCQHLRSVYTKHRQERNNLLGRIS